MIAPFPTVSVVVPAYNVAPFIGAALASVRAQTFSDFEVIVVNAGSPDTSDLEAALAPYGDRIVYVKQENRGAGAARNAGLRLARGEYIAFLDGDDIWLPEFLADQMSLLTDGGYDLVYANAMFIGESPVAGRTYMELNPSEGEVTFESLLAGRCVVITSGVLVRKQPVFQVGLFDESLRNSQDFDLWLRLARDGGVRIGYQRKVLLHHRKREGSLASDPTDSLGGEIQVLEKVGRRGDLTGAQRASLEATLSQRRANLEIARGKYLLADGDFDGAESALQCAYAHQPNPKLKSVLVALRLAPRLVQRTYQILGS